MLAWLRRRRVQRLRQANLTRLALYYMATAQGDYDCAAQHRVAIFECTRRIAALTGEAESEPTLSDDRSLDSWAEEQKRRRVSLDSQIERRER
jgi:hypothetical protein